MVIGPTNMALTLAGSEIFNEIVFGFANPPTSVNDPVVKVAMFASPATVTVTLLYVVL